MPKWSQKICTQLSDAWLLLANQHRFLWLFLPLLGLLCGLLGGCLDIVVDLGRTGTLRALLAPICAFSALWLMCLSWRARRAWIVPAHYYVAEQLAAEYYTQYALWTLFLVVFSGTC
jgi:hypothetical protein